MLKNYPRVRFITHILYKLQRNNEKGCKREKIKNRITAWEPVTH